MPIPANRDTMKRRALTIRAGENENIASQPPMRNGVHRIEGAATTRRVPANWSSWPGDLVLRHSWSSTSMYTKIQKKIAHATTAWRMLPTRYWVGENARRPPIEMTDPRMKTAVIARIGHHSSRHTYS